MKIILASKSPRRQQLISELNIDFRIEIFDADESFPSHLQGSAIAEYLSRKKAEHFTQTLTDDEVLLTCDTIVWINGEVLNKPESVEDAYRMLDMISGDMHMVYTGVTLKSNKKTHTFHEATEVYFKNLSREHITYYINQYQPMDKAGAYGIQEWIGYIGVEKINGCYYNVMGLPVSKVYEELQYMIL